MKHSIIFLVLMLINMPLISQEKPVSHIHGDRTHNHPLPSSGVGHRHGKGIIGSMPVYINNKPTINSSQPRFEKRGDCDQGNAEACYREAVKLKNKNDINKARSLVAKACDLGKSTVCQLAGNLFIKINDHQKAEYYFSKGCKGGMIESCYMLGIFYVEGIQPPNSQKALIYLLKSCDAGHIMGCAMTGNEFYKKEQYFKALVFYKKACFSNEKLAIAVACIGVGNTAIQLSGEFNLGKKVDSELKKIALNGYKRSCDANDTEGFSKLSCSSYRFFKKGYTKQERKQAEISCNRRNKLSCIRLASIYGNGRGVKKNMEKSSIYAKKACSAGDQDMCKIYQAYISPPSNYNSSSSSSNTSNYSAPQKTCRQVPTWKTVPVLGGRPGQTTQVVEYNEECTY